MKDFLIAQMKLEDKCNNNFKMLRENNYQPKLVMVFLGERGKIFPQEQGQNKDIFRYIINEPVKLSKKNFSIKHAKEEEICP